MLGDHVEGESVLAIKKLIRAPDMDVIHSQNLREVLAGVDRLVTGVTMQEFGKLARREKKHRL